MRIFALCYLINSRLLSCSLKLNTAKHSITKRTGRQKSHVIRRELFVLVFVIGHLAVTELQISIERFRFF